MKFKIIFSIVLSIFAQQAYSQFGPGGRLCPPNQCNNCWTITFERDVNYNNSCNLSYYWHYPGIQNCGDVLAYHTIMPTPLTHTGPCMSCMDGPCQCPSGLILGYFPYNGPLIYFDFTDPSKFPINGPFPFTFDHQIVGPQCNPTLIVIRITVTGPYSATIRIL